MPELDEYRRWLANGVSNREVVETFEIIHPAWQTLRIVNADRSIRATLEDGVTQVTFSAGRFYMEPSETTDTVSQSTTVALSSLDGRLYDIVRGMTFEERQTPIRAVYRMFFFDDPSAPLVSPPPVWYVSGLEATREAVRVQLQATQLRVRRIGLYYTAQEFPAIVYL